MKDLAKRSSASDPGVPASYEAAHRQADRRTENTQEDKAAVLRGMSAESPPPDQDHRSCQRRLVPAWHLKTGHGLRHGRDLAVRPVFDGRKERTSDSGRF